MEKIYNYKKAQYARLNDLYEFEDQNEVNPNVLDVENYEENLPVVEFDDVNDYLADNFQEEETFDEQLEEPQIPMEITDEELPEFGTTEEALDYAIKNNEVVRINYTTKKGIDLTRIVEPHLLFAARESGNLIVVTYDRSVRGIRAYIVPNILNYIFTGKEFKKRMRIVPSSNKERMAMEKNIFNDMKKVGERLTQLKLNKSAEIINDASNKLKEIKEAQYVGIQGYWIRNRRCFDNCYRQKRASQPNSAAQEVWMECWQEYQDSINDDKSGWEKYADKKTEIKIADKTELRNRDKKFAEKVSEKIKAGSKTGEAIYATLEEEEQEQVDTLIDNANSLLELATSLKENNFNEEGEKVAELSMAFIKEAQRSPFGSGGVSGFLGGVRDMWRGRTPEGELKNVVNRISQIANRVGQFAQEFGAINHYLAQEVNPQAAEAAMPQQPGASWWDKAKGVGQAVGKGVGQAAGFLGQKGQEVGSKLKQMGPEILNRMRSSEEEIELEKEAQGAAPPAPSPVGAPAVAPTPGATPQIQPDVRNQMNRMAVQYMTRLRDVYAQMLEHLRTESTNLGKISGTSQSPQVKDVAQKSLASIKEFFKKTSGLSQNLNDLVAFKNSAPDLTSATNYLANKLNNIMATAGTMAEQPSQGEQPAAKGETAPIIVDMSKLDQYSPENIQSIINILQKALASKSQQVSQGNPGTTATGTP